MREEASTPAASKAARAARRWLSVSTVPPDFELTTTTVRSRSVNAARTWPGSVVSRVTSGLPAVAQMTSGASELPPMPASTTRSTPSAASSSRSAVICGSSSRPVATASSQPSRTVASGVASGPQRVASLAASFATTPSARAAWRATEREASSEPPTVCTVTPPPRDGAVVLVGAGHRQAGQALVARGVPGRLQRASSTNSEGATPERIASATSSGPGRSAEVTGRSPRWRRPPGRRRPARRRRRGRRRRRPSPAGR